MNYKMVLNILGKVMIIEAIFLIFPIFVALSFDENFISAFLIPAGSLLVIGVPLSLIKYNKKLVYAKEGFVIVSLSWIVLSLVGAIPFMLTSVTTNYCDAFFEAVSGFTTTGASIFNTVEDLPKCINFWRCFTHWLGGMGVLVFLLAVLPSSGEGATMHIYRAESPGPTSGKLVSKMSKTAKILYLIYVLLTIIEFLMLSFGNMSLYDSICSSLATAGTGGFGIKNTSIGGYSTYIQMVIAVFMFIFGINFNFFYLILIGNVAKAFRSEEIIVYFAIVLFSTLIIAWNLYAMNQANVYGFGDALRLSFFQVTSISSSTGFSTTNFVDWPSLSKAILVFLMLFGACAGSTGGGMKIARLIILSKSTYADLRKTISHRQVKLMKFEGEPLKQETINSTRSYFVCWFAIVVIVTCLISITGFQTAEGVQEVDLATGLTATLSCIGNIGPGMTNLIGPAASFAGFSNFAKILLSIVMLAGRLEIFPIIYLFSPKTWRKA